MVSSGRFIDFRTIMNHLMYSANEEKVKRQKIDQQVSQRIERQKQWRERIKCFAIQEDGELTYNRYRVPATDIVMKLMIIKNKSEQFGCLGHQKNSDVKLLSLAETPGTKVGFDVQYGRRAIKTTFCFKWHIQKKLIFNVNILWSGR